MGLADDLQLTLDREAEVPVSTQLAWGLRARILGGALAAGERLPTLRELAEAVGVNLNTVRAVYSRLESDGLVQTRHGVGTTVAETSSSRGDLAQLVAATARAANDAGIDMRDVAAALYTDGDDPPEPDDEALRRRALRAQIAAFEQALGELARRPDLVAASKAPRRSGGPRLLSVAELEAQRDDVLRRLTTAQQAVAARPPRPRQPKPAVKNAAQKTPKTKAPVKRAARRQLGVASSGA